jgi:hypothetical protein
MTPKTKLIQLRLFPTREDHVRSIELLVQLQIQYEDLESFHGDRPGDTALATQSQ